MIWLIVALAAVAGSVMLGVAVGKWLKWRGGA